MKERIPIVVVDWHDAFTHDEWTSSNTEADQDYLCRSVGFLVKQSTKRIIIAQTLAAEGRQTNTLTIPRPWVRRMRKVPR